MGKVITGIRGCRTSLVVLSSVLCLIAYSHRSQVCADEGDLLWSQNYGGDFVDYAYSLIETSGGEYLMAGATSSFGAGGCDVWLLSVNSDGDSLWSNTYGGSSDEFAFEVIEISDGNFLVGGWTASFGVRESDMWLVKTDLQGDSLWSCTYGGDNSDYAYALTETQEGDYLLAGITASFGSGATDMWLLKAGPQGDSLWACVVGGPGTESIFSVIESSSGGYISVGTTSSTPTSFNDIWLVKTDVNGNLLWSRNYGGINDDYAYSMVETAGGDFVIAGYSNSFGMSFWDNDIWLIKADSDGDTLWSRLYDFGGDEITSSVIETSDGGYLLAGWTSPLGSGDSDIWLLKTDSDGDSLWSRTYGDIGNDYAYTVIQTSDGDYLIAGETHTAMPDIWDALLICVEGIPTGVEPQVSLQPFSHSYLGAFPNPFNPTTTISFDLPVVARVNLAVYDVSGRLVAEVVDGWRQAGVHEVAFNATDLPSEVYFVRLTAGGLVQTHKLLLLK